jgi:large subunit ribosomal protein L10
MPLLKAQKKELAKTYAQQIVTGKNVTVLVFDKIPVNEVNTLRMKVAEAEGSLQVVKKRVFLKAMDGVLDGLTLDQAGTTTMLLYSNNESDEYAPLKAVNNVIKLWKKEKKEYVLWYVGWRFDKEWKQSSWVSELAGLPTKEELVGKFLFLLNHPMSSFARALQAIADKKAE